MKIAVITDDGKTISQHFGRAQHYMVFTIEDKKVVNKELRDKLGHGQFQDHDHQHHEAGQHGFDAQSHNRHTNMAEAISDCEALICGGMGAGAYQSMRMLNIKPMVSDIRDVEQAVEAYIAGNLVDHTEKLH